MNATFRLCCLGSLLLLLLGLGCQLEDPQAGLEPEQLITLELSDSVLVADGQSVLTLTAQLGPDASANQLITFATEAGRFESPQAGAQSLSLRASGRSVSAVLVSGTEVDPRVIVTASVTANQDNETFTYEAQRLVSFVRAYPDEMQLSLSEAQLPALPGESTTLFVQMLRDRGEISGGTRVFFQAQPAPDQVVDVEVEPFAFADTDQTSVTVTNRDTLVGTALLRAWVLDEAGDTAVSQQISLRIDSL
jgi:hypothetical protein